jgi:hypothetical protein
MELLMLLLLVLMMAVLGSHLLVLLSFVEFLELALVLV